jgi:hypothetical protein
MSNDLERLQRLAQIAQSKQDQLSQQSAAAHSERVEKSRTLAHEHVQEWIRIIELSIAGHPYGAGYEWSIREGWWSTKAQWSRSKETTPRIDLSRIFRLHYDAILKMHHASSIIDLDTYVSAVNEQLGGIFEIGHAIYADEFGTLGGAFGWKRQLATKKDSS